MERSGYVTCGACGLSHPPRRDGICPRCGQELRGQASAVAAPAAADGGATGAGAHAFAGWVFVVLGLLGLVAAAVALQDPRLTDAGLAPQLGAGLASFVELALGGFIVAGVSWARKIAIVMCVLGLVTTLPISLMLGPRVDTAVVALRVVLVVGSLLLLVGRPGTGRTALGGLLLVAHLLLRARVSWGAAQWAGRWSEFWKVWQ